MAESSDKKESTAPVASKEEVAVADVKGSSDAEAATKEEDSKTAENDEAASEKQEEAEKAAGDDGDTEMKDAAEAGATEGEADAASAVPETPAAKNKNRRKSTGGESKGKSLSKKGSKARLTHIDAQPGDHFLVKLKGFPAWPAIICDESMLPLALVNSRPVSAARPDGSYTEAYADGGKRVNDRSFPVMYLYTNEFGWVANTALSELTAEKAKDTITDKMRKDLKAAFELAAEHNPIDHYKDILQSFQDELLAQEEAKKEAAATPKKGKKSKAKVSEDEDVEMEDAEEAPPKSSKSKKRKADEDTATPQRSESVKKPKIKLNTSSTPKAANGTASAKKDTSNAKSSKTKSKKGKEGDKKAEAKEVKMTPEEKHIRKEKEVLYLRHKLQRGILTKESPPVENEMEQMSGYIQLLENFNDLEVSIIRATKINKVLKAILKVDSIPREDDFNFKKRSQTLLDKWNKLLASDEAAGATNGVNGSAEGKTDKPAASNGVKDDEEAKKTDSEKTTEDSPEESKSKGEDAKSKEEVSPEKEEEKADDEAPTAAEAVEATA